MRPERLTAKESEDMGGHADPRLLALVDQMLAAQRDVTDLIGWVAPDLRGWRKVDECTIASVDAMLSRALAEHGQFSARICPHAWAGILGDAPRPQVLDADRGILACLEGCYMLLMTKASQDPDPPTTVVRCFDCGRYAGIRPLDNLLIAYGPVLIVGSLCERCDRDWFQARSGSPGGF